MNILIILLIILIGAFTGYAASSIGLESSSFYIGAATSVAILIFWILRTQNPSSPKIVIPKANGKNSAPLIFLYSGIVICITGIGLYVGNLSGVFSTFPFAGGITSGIGVVIFALSKVALENRT